MRDVFSHKPSQAAEGPGGAGARLGSGPQEGLVVGGAL